MKKPSEHIAHSLDLIRNNKNLREKLLVVEVKSHLHALFGDVVDQYIKHVRVQHKTLHLHLNSSTLKHELHHEKLKFLQRLHDKIGFEAFEDVQFHG